MGQKLVKAWYARIDEDTENEMISTDLDDFLQSLKYEIENRNDDIEFKVGTEYIGKEEYEMLKEFVGFDLSDSK